MPTGDHTCLEQQIIWTPTLHVLAPDVSTDVQAVSDVSLLHKLERQPWRCGEDLVVQKVLGAVAYGSKSERVKYQKLTSLKRTCELRWEK